MRLKAALAVGALLMVTPATAATRVRIMYTAVSGYSASYVAKDQGFFEKNGGLMLS